MCSTGSRGRCPQRPVMRAVGAWRQSRRPGWGDTFAEGVCAPLRLQHSIGSAGLQRADIIRPYGVVFCTGFVGEAISFPLCQRDGKPALPCPRSAAAGIRTQSPPAVSDMANRQRGGKPVPYDLIRVQVTAYEILRYACDSPRASLRSVARCTPAAAGVRMT